MKPSNILIWVFFLAAACIAGSFAVGYYQGTSKQAAYLTVENTRLTNELTSATEKLKTQKMPSLDLALECDRLSTELRAAKEKLKAQETPVPLLAAPTPVPSITVKMADGIDSSEANPASNLKNKSKRKPIELPPLNDADDVPVPHRKAPRIQMPE